MLEDLEQVPGARPVFVPAAWLDAFAQISYQSVFQVSRGPHTLAILIIQARKVGWCHFSSSAFDQQTYNVGDSVAVLVSSAHPYEVLMGVLGLRSSLTFEDPTG